MLNIFLGGIQATRTRATPIKHVANKIGRNELFFDRLLSTRKRYSSCCSQQRNLINHLK